MPRAFRTALGHEVGAAARAAGADAFAFDLFHVGNAAFFECNHLQQVRVHDGHAEDLVLFTFELGKPLVSGHGHVTHDLPDNGFTLVGQLDIFHAGAGHFRHGLDTGHVFGPDLGDPAAIRIVDTAGTAGADADKGCFGCNGACHEQYKTKG